MGASTAFNTLGMKYNKAVNKFVWKPKLIPLIKQYDSILDIAKNEG